MNIYNLLKGSITQKDLLNHYNANITYIKLPTCVNGFIFQYKNIYNIFVNENLSYYKRKKTIIHELAHIELAQLNQMDKDMFKFKINKYEDEADNYVKYIIESLGE